MAKLFNLGNSNGLKAHYDFEVQDNFFEQDVTAHLEDAKYQRDIENYFGKQKKSGLRKFATIPDGVALKILADHKLDVHDPMFNDNPINMRKLKQIMLSEYRDLVINS